MGHCVEIYLSQVTLVCFSGQNRLSTSSLVLPCSPKVGTGGSCYVLPLHINLLPRRSYLATKITSEIPAGYRKIRKHSLTQYVVGPQCIYKGNSHESVPYRSTCDFLTLLAVRGQRLSHILPLPPRCTGVVKTHVM